MTIRRALFLAVFMVAAVAGAWGQALTVTSVSHPSAAAGTFYFSVLFQASGGTPGYTWTLQPASNSDGLTLDPATGFLSGFPQTGGSFSIAVTVTDSLDAQASTSSNLNVLGITTASLPNGFIGTAYSQTLAAAGNNGALGWTLLSGSLPPGLNLNPLGQITGTPTGGGTFPFQVSVTDGSDGLSSSSSLSINVPLSLTMTTTSLPNGTVGTSYPAQTLVATGGSGSLNWTLVSGALPPGFNSINAQGQITGTPTQSGTFTFQVRATDAITSLTATQSLSITITPTLTMSTTSLPSGTIGVGYSQTLLAAGGTSPYTWSASGLPAGLMLDPNTGILSGTPTAIGTSTISITLTDAAQGTLVKQLSSTIAALTTPTVVISGLPTIGVAATQPAATVALSNGTYPLTITGTMTLTFASSVGGDDQMVQFSNGTRTATFTIAAGTTQGLFGTASSVSVLIGTVAGTITITTTLVDSNNNTLAPPAPVVIPVNPTVPVIKGVTIGTVTTSGFSISVTGYSTARNMTNALFHFTSPTNTQLASADINVPLTTAFTSWYGNSASNAFGSQFIMTVQFSFTGPPGTIVPFTTVTVTLTNSVGVSTTTAPVSP